MVKYAFGYGCRHYRRHKVDPVQKGANVREKDTDYAKKGLFAVRRLSKHAQVCEISEPLVFALDSPRLKDTCYYCFEKEEDPAGLQPWGRGEDYYKDNKLRPCRCGVVKFCSSDCGNQANDRFHKYECDIFEALAPRVLPSNIRAVLRGILLTKAGRWEHETWTKALNARNHAKTFETKGGERWEQICLMTQSVIEYSGTDETFEDVSKLFCSLIINSFPLMTPYFDSIGIAMHPLIGKINHSCNPNAVIRANSGSRWFGPDLSVNALRTIDADEEITISYLEPNTLYENRRVFLKSDYFFTCKCGKCASESGLPRNATAKLRVGLGAVEPKIMQLFETANSTTSTSARIESYRYCLHLLLSSECPLTLEPFPKALKKLIFAYIDQHQFNLAFAYAALLHFRIHQKVADTEVSPSEKAMCTFVLFRLADCILESQEWASQKLDLVSRYLEMVFWRWLWIHELDNHRVRLVGDSMMTTFSHQKAKMRQKAGNLPADVIGDPEKKRLAMVGLDKLMDDVLENLKTWRGELR